VVKQSGFTLRALLAVRPRPRGSLIKPRWRHVSEMGPAAGSDSASTIVVPTRGITAVDRRILTFILLFAPFALLITLFLTPGGPSVNLFPKLGLWAGLLVLIGLLMTASISVRRVDVDQSGITVRYLFDKRRATWAALTPSPHPPRKGMWSLYSRPTATGVGKARRYIVTVEQARAILSHPSRPVDWVIPPAVRTGLGLASA
jgi:hypothetical protein